MRVSSLRKNFYRRLIRPVQEQFCAPLKVILLARILASRPLIFPRRFKRITQSFVEFAQQPMAVCRILVRKHLSRLLTGCKQMFLGFAGVQ